MNNKLIFFAGLLLSMESSVMPQGKLDIGQALAEAAANQPIILQAEAALDAARARRMEAKSAYFPYINGTATYAYIAPQRGQELDFEPYLPLDIERPTSSRNAIDIGLGLGMVVYDAGRRSLNLDLASREIDEAGIDMNRARTSVAYATARAFYALLFLRAEIGVLDEQALVLDRHLDEARAREETGSSTHYDVLTTQVREAAITKQRIESKKQYDREKAILAQLTNRREDFEVVGDFRPLRSAIDEEASIKSAVSAGDDLRLALVAERQAELKAEIARLGTSPTVMIKAAAGYKNGVLTYDNSDVDKLMFNWNIGVTLDMPIFDGFLVSHKREESLAALSAARNRDEEIRRNTMTQIRAAISDIRASRLQTENSLSQLAEAEEALEIARTQYSFGVFTNLQFLDSQASLELAKLENLRAMYHEVLSELAFKQAMGEDLSALMSKD
jgi:outer membrane protein